MVEHSRSNAKVENQLIRIKNWLFGPSSKYNVGDTVQLKDDDKLMVVIEVIRERGMKSPLIHCRWQEKEPRQTRQNYFSEESLRLFDWYEANRNK